MATKQAATTEALTISAPNFKVAIFHIKGSAPYVQLQFSKKAKNVIKAQQEAGSTAKSKKKREAKNFEKLSEEAKHVSTDGWCGIPAPGIRAAMVSACKIVGFHMTKAKLGCFVMADGYDKDDATPLVKITKGEPHYCEHHVRNATGVVDLRPRAMWDPGWEAKVSIRYDADMFTLEDMANLLMRVGQQVGLGEGRPDSKKSCGMGWGTFDLVGKPKDSK